MLRIGQGIDLHQFAEQRKLVLGGVEIAEGPGLIGHSDADVLLHALIDSLLGATGRGDIGSYFPNTDMRWKDVSSLKLLSIIWQEIRIEGWLIHNLDCTILAEVPKILPYISEMKKNIAEVLNIDAAQIGIKATTTETMGAIGRKEGICAFVVALLER